MPIAQNYYGSVYDQQGLAQDQNYYTPPQGSISQQVGHLTADDNGAAQVIDPGKLYQTLTGPMQAAQRRRAELDKQLRLSYMNYDSSKIPNQYRPGYQKLYNDWADFYKNNAQLLRKGDIAAASQLEQKQNELKDYTEQARQRAGELKALTTKSMSVAAKKNPDFVDQFHQKINSYNDPYDELTDAYSLFNGNDKLDPYKAETKLNSSVAKPIQVKTGTAPNGAAIYSYQPNTEGNMKLVANFVDNTPEGKALIEALADRNDIPYHQAHELYVQQKTQELNQRSLGGVNTMNKYDDHGFNTGIKQGMYNMATEAFPLKQELMRSQIERNKMGLEFGQSPMVAQQFYQDISDSVARNPVSAVNTINQLTAAKNSINASLPLKYNANKGTIEGTLLNSSGKPVLVNIPASEAGGAQMVQLLQNTFVNPTQAATQQRLKTRTTTKPTVKKSPTKKTIPGF